MTAYTVTAERSGDWWTLQCIEVPGAVSQTKDLDEAEGLMREAIGFVAEVPDEDVEVTVRLEPAARHSSGVERPSRPDLRSRPRW